MNIWTTFQLILGVLVSIQVQCFQVGMCPKKDPPHGLWVLAPGKEVTLSCSGRVTVDGVDITQSRGSPRGSEEEDSWRTSEKMKRTSSGGGHARPTVAWRGAEDQTTEEYGGQRLDGVDSTTVSHSGLQDGVGHSRHKGKNLNLTSEDGGDMLDGGLNGSQVKAAHSLGAPAVTETNTSGSDGAKDEAMGTVEQVHRGLRERAQWTVNGTVRLTGRDGGEMLILASLRPSDSGVYSCHQGRKQAFSVKILVAAPPEKPTLSCLRKTPTSKVRCDWIATQPITPTPQCYLNLKKGLLGQLFTLNCSYSVSRARCWCVLEILEGERESYQASLCVTSIAGNVTSPFTEIHPLNIIKPDPPRNLSAQGEEGKERRLKVTWSNPLTWKVDFYRLRFHLQYFPILQGKEKGEQKQEAFTQALFYTIRDALPHSRYLLRVRAREEFNTGQWSDWSPVVYAYTWTAPEPSATSVVTSISDMYSFIGDASGMPPEDLLSVPVTQPPVNPMWVHLTWAFGAGMIIILTVLAAYILRHRERFISKLHKLGRRSTPHTPAPPPSQQPRTEGNPLMSPEPSTYPKNEEPPFLQEEEERGEGIHLNNIGYFLLQRN